MFHLKLTRIAKTAILRDVYSGKFLHIQDERLHIGPTCPTMTMIAAVAVPSNCVNSAVAKLGAVARKASAKATWILITPAHFVEWRPQIRHVAG